MSTADQEGRRLWLYPRKPRGPFYRARIALSWLLLAILFAGPFIRIDGHPLLLLNVVERRFVVLGQVFWPQDMILFAVAVLVFITGIIVFTAAFGRLWCGWACPQTVLMEMVFRRIEHLLEGDAPAQRALARAPWTAGKLAKKAVKHAIFLGLSFLIGNTLLAYLIGTEALFGIVTDNPLNHLTGLTFMLLFTLVFYAIFARFREQACTFICPYGRFQSTLLDEHSIVVAYDYRREQMPDGHFSNLYTIRVVNKTHRTMPVELKLENVPGDVRVMGQGLVVPPEKQAETSVLIELDRQTMTGGKTPLVVGVYSEGRRLRTLKTAFIGPRDDTR